MQLRRAQVADVWSYAIAANWSPQAHEYRLLVQEAVSGRVWCGVADGVPLVLGGVLPVGDGLPAYCWMMASPAAAASMTPLALMMRRVIREEAPSHAGVVCAVRDDNDKGARLARALGFAPTDETCGMRRNWRL